MRHPIAYTLLVAAFVATPTVVFAQDTNEGASTTEPELTPQQTAAERFDWAGEEILFTIRALGADVIRATMSISQVQNQAGVGQVYSVSVNGRTHGFFDLVYSVENEALSYVVLDTGLPLFSHYDYNERDYVSTNTIAWYHDGYYADVRREDPDGEERERVLIPSNTYDEASMFLDLRTRDLSVGNQLVYYQYDGLGVNRYIGTVERHEDVYVLDRYVPTAHIAFTSEPMETVPALPYATGLVNLPPAMRATDTPSVMATGLIGLENRHLLLGADIDTSIGNLEIRALEYHGPR